MQGEHFGDLVADGKNRIERCHRFLKDHGDAVATNATDLLGGQIQQVLPIEIDATVHDPAGRIGYQAHDGLGGHTLSAA
jgi:hypothetical protein